MGRPNNLMDNQTKREKLEQELRTAQGPERRTLLRELAALAGHCGADTRPRGEESEKR